MEEFLLKHEAKKQKRHDLKTIQRTAADRMLDQMKREDAELPGFAGKYQAPFNSIDNLLGFIHQIRKREAPKYPDGVAIFEDGREVRWHELGCCKTLPGAIYGPGNFKLKKWDYSEEQEVGTEGRSKIEWFDKNYHLIKKYPANWVTIPPGLKTQEDVFQTTLYPRFYKELSDTFPYWSEAKRGLETRMALTKYWQDHGGPYIYSCDGAARFLVPIADFELKIPRGDFQRDFVFGTSTMDLFGLCWDGIREYFAPFPLPPDGQAGPGCRCAVHGVITAPPDSPRPEDARHHIDFQRHLTLDQHGAYIEKFAGKKKEHSPFWWCHYAINIGCKHRAVDTFKTWARNAKLHNFEELLSDVEAHIDQEFTD